MGCNDRPANAEEAQVYDWSAIIKRIEGEKMAEITLNDDQLKQLLKAAIVEILQEQKEVFADLMMEAMEEIALVKAIEEGEDTEMVDRETIFNLLANGNED